MSMDEAQHDQQADGSSVIGTLAALASSESVLADISALLAKVLPTQVRALPTPRCASLRGRSALMLMRDSIRQADHATQPGGGSLDSAATAPSAPAEQDAFELTAQTKRSRFFSRNGRAPEAPPIARSTSVPMRSSSTDNAARSRLARASSMTAALQQPCRQALTNGPELSEATARRATSSRGESTSQRSTEMDAAQPVRAPAPAGRRGAGPAMVQLPVLSEAFATMQNAEANRLRQRAGDADIDSGHDNHDQAAPQRMTDATAENHFCRVASTLPQQHQDADIGQEGAKPGDTRSPEQMPASPVHNRQRVSTHTVGAPERAPGVQSMAGR